MTPEQTIAEDGPRVLARYGRDYFNGWCAGLKSSTDEALRDAAGTIRAHITTVILDHGIGFTDGGWFGAADLIDPDKETT
ncbi:hypothetical protein XF35_01645 [Streptomyces platensis subsp. clarensis]|nr:hypothetical protein [Streptomyces platensis subsp. clarensis]